jgi:hypothetical protein
VNVPDRMLNCRVVNGQVPGATDTGRAEVDHMAGYGLRSAAPGT